MITIAHARRLRKLIEQAVISLSDTDALDGVELFPRWQADHDYSVDDRVNYDGTLYKCLLAHKSQADWLPDISTSLWVRVDDPHIEFPDWVQPVGAADAYRIGAKVSHNEKHWVSAIDYNVYEPGVYGWDEVQ